MKIQVFDTYVRKPDGETMHFDVFMPEDKSKEDAFEAATTYVKSKGVVNGEVTANECSFCHVQDATDEQEKVIKEKGYFIYEMTGCD